MLTAKLAPSLAVVIAVVYDFPAFLLQLIIL